MSHVFNYPLRSRRAGAHAWLANQAYAWGLASATSWGMADGHEHVQIFWRGKRCYFLRWPRWKWRCLLRFHHWPTDYTVVFDMCGRCCPWPCCGAITVAHADGCNGEDGR